MKVLWAPWRKAYVEKVDEQTGCFLCEAAEAPEERLPELLVVYRGERAFVILNKYPYNAGHLMVAPKAHLGSYELLDDETALEMHRLLKLSIKALKKVYAPHGFNAGYNLGRAAGAGLEGHLHQHLVPRWVGDTNFMPVLAETKVVSESLSESYRRIKEAFTELLRGSA
ncbi:MAG: HIT domain-containing protein [Aquificae bacterium]|nr:HIT domain-containing protein [Aquificota bacterium]